MMRMSKLMQLATKQSSPLALIASQRVHTLSSLSRSSPLSSRHQSLSLSLRRAFGTEELDNDDILERTKKVLELTADSHIYNDIGLDSLDFVEFGIALEDDKAEGITTVGDAI